MKNFRLKIWPVIFGGLVLACVVAFQCCGGFQTVQLDPSANQKPSSGGRVRMSLAPGSLDGAYMLSAARCGTHDLMSLLSLGGISGLGVTISGVSADQVITFANRTACC